MEEAQTEKKKKKIFSRRLMLQITGYLVGGVNGFIYRAADMSPVRTHWEDPNRNEQQDSYTDEGADSLWTSQLHRPPLCCCLTHCKRSMHGASSLMSRPSEGEDPCPSVSL